MDGANPSPTSPLPDGGSFRDWDGRVFVEDGRILRALSARAVEDWEALAASELFRAFTGNGMLVGTEPAGEATLAALQAADPEGAWAGALVHERLPFVSYPYEWSFSMLKDAALLQLKLTAAALGEGLTLKDATPYNVQWRGSQPVFIDVGSFERVRPGEPWAGYRQFCELYLYPLLLEAYRGVPFQPLLRGRIDGLPPTEFRALFSLRDALRRGMLRHVFLHAALDRRNAGRTGEVKSELGEAGFDTKLVAANVAQLEHLVGRLRARTTVSDWRDYRTTCSYGPDEAATKDDFVRRALAHRRRRLVWDLGCNDGRYARLAAGGSDFVVALDSDRVLVDDLYTKLREAGDHSVLPLVVDLTDPSPAVGWRNRERRALLERDRPDLVLCLALVHHLSISANVPLREVVEWLRGMSCEVVVEFPDRTDPMVERLLAAKREESHPDYDRDRFERLLQERFDVADQARLPTGTRSLYFLRPR